MQGYAISEDEINLSLDDFKANYGGSAIEYVVDTSAHGRGREAVALTFLGVRCSKTKINFKAVMANGDAEIYIFYSDEASVGIKTMRK